MDNGATSEEKSSSIQKIKSLRIQGIPYEHFIDQRSAFIVNGQDIHQILSIAPNQLNIAVKESLDSDIQPNIGSAAAITRDGYYLTAAHVLNEHSAEHLWLIPRHVSNRRYSKARVVWISEKADIAIVKAKYRTAFYQFGNPKWYKNFTVIVAGLFGGNSSGSILEVNKYSSKRPDILKVVHTSPITKGDSGGALLSKKGELIGINYKLEKTINSYGLSLVRGHALFLSPEKVFQIIQNDRLKIH